MSSGIPGLIGVRCGQCHCGMIQHVTLAPEGLTWRNEPCPHCVAGWVAWFPEEQR